MLIRSGWLVIWSNKGSDVYLKNRAATEQYENHLFEFGV